MGNVVNLFDKKEGYEVQYIMEDGKVIGVTHPSWPFRIQRKDDEIALVAEDNDEPFGIIDADMFNTILMCWLLIDAPKLIEESCSG